jgi:hypothetical protein
MIFLSYSREDAKAVSELATHIRNSGGDVWMDVSSIAGGGEWRDQIAEGISGASVIVLNVSPSACASDYVRKEVFFGIRHKKPIVPVLVGGGKSVELPYALELELGHLHFLRWPEDGLQRIIEAVNVNQGGALLAEDQTLRLVKELMESEVACLVSLAKDFIAYKRLVPCDAEMAALRAVRIALRSITYLAQALGSKSVGDDGKFIIAEVLSQAHADGLIGTTEAKGVEILLNLGERMSLDDILSSDGEGDSSLAFSNVEQFVQPLAALLRAVWDVSKSPNKRAAISSKLEVVKGSAATKEMLQQAFLVGQRTFGEAVMPSFSGMERMHAANPDIYNFLVESSTGICIGYTSVVPLDQSGLEATLKREFDHIPTDEILTFSFPGFYFVHLSSVAVDPAYRDLSQAFATLTNALIEDFLFLAEKDIFIVGMSADAITANGHRICNALGMKAIENRPGGSTLFYGSLLPPTTRFATKKGIQLLKVYKKAFEEMGDFCPNLEFTVGEKS